MSVRVLAAQHALCQQAGSMPSMPGQSKLSLPLGLSSCMLIIDRRTACRLLTWTLALACCLALCQ